MELLEAQQILTQVSGTLPVGDWGQDLIMAVQRALAELYLLNPADDVDGLLGPRTREAWKFFQEATNQLDPDTIGRDSARLLIQASDNPTGLIGQAKITLQPDFEFRRRQSQANRDKSVPVIIAEAQARRVSKAQLAYILATAEHETDSFQTLEEYASGDAYEGQVRRLGNTQAGDGHRFKGRGYVQLTGRRNYALYAATTGFELVKFPIILMNRAALSAFVLVDGMMRGAYTTLRLDQFVNSSKQDFYNARQVVNGLDRAQKIADQAND